MEHSFIQKLFKALLPQTTFADMEKESRVWMIQCEKCKYEKSIWEMGGVRWKAAGNPKKYRMCAICGERNWHTVYKKTE